MILSENWLREWVDPEIDCDSLAHRLTMAGLEVDSVTSLADGLAGVVVGEIVAAEPHPDADKLRVCRVDTGSETVQIVCGAPNVAPGLKAPLAQPGAKLPGGIKIKKAKLRGVESQGMLCSSAELNLSDDHDGLLALASDAPVGMPIETYFDLDDRIIEIGLTPNRADCLSVMGVARDLAVSTGAAFNAPPMETIETTIPDAFPVEVTASAKCPRYLGRVIRDVDVSRPTPMFMVERLRRSGIRSIDAVVDITNYVMLELGQPLHAFDLAALEGGIRVREAGANERITLLDGEERTLSEGTLVISDHQKALAIAGIMGGEGSAICFKTRDLFLEAAFFAPALMAGCARHYGLHTDASHRYERGVDPELAFAAMERATALIIEYVGGRAGPVTDVTSAADLPPTEPVMLRASAVKQLLGVDVPDREITRILQGLGFLVEAGAAKSSWLCTAPSWRFDMGREADLIEEIARIVGYEHIPARPLQGAASPQSMPESQLALSVIKQQLAARGFNEAITFSFVSSGAQGVIDPDIDPITLRNPISSDLSVMRTSLIPGLVAAAAHNLKRQQTRVRLFETGLRFLPGEVTDQRSSIGLLLCGSRFPESWSAPSEVVDFYDMKGELENLLGTSADQVIFRAAKRAGLHDGQSAEILMGGRLIGVMGCLHPTAAKALDVPDKTYVAELDLDAAMGRATPAYRDFSKFPEVRRDIALIVGSEVSATQVLDIARHAAGDTLTSALIFDVYEGDGMAENEKSLAVGLTFRDQSRTLTDEEISESLAQVVESLSEKLGARPRY